MSSGPNWPVIRDFGVIDIDWSNSKQEWINTDPMTCEENLLKQAQLIKAKNPLGKGQKVWVYRNTGAAATSHRRMQSGPCWFSPRQSVDRCSRRKRSAVLLAYVVKSSKS
jgi:hypothetical protein